MIQIATLAVGTEVTDGQILDRNSALLSQLGVDLGFKVIEHRAVPDEHVLILRAIEDIGSRVDILFITGGLGPTSDDFTRELIAKFVGSPLEFDENSWAHVGEILNQRGVARREIQKQQCYFPRGSKIYKNPAGTANAFSIAKNDLRIFALPGPPNEIQAVWKAGLAEEFQGLVSPPEREALQIWRCMGRGESDIAELVEPIIANSGLRVGYRAHAPYVEVKLWSKSSQAAVSNTVSKKIDETLSPFLINRNQEDLARDLLMQLGDKSLQIVDCATLGILGDRIFSVMRDEGLAAKVEFTTFSDKNFGLKSPAHGLQLVLKIDQFAQEWEVGCVSSKGEAWQKIKPIYKHKVDSERGRKYICEKALQILIAFLAKTT